MPAAIDIGASRSLMLNDILPLLSNRGFPLIVKAPTNEKKQKKKTRQENVNYSIATLNLHESIGLFYFISSIFTNHRSNA